MFQVPKAGNMARSVLVFLAFFSMLLVPTNPDYNFPLLPELVSLVVLSLCAFLTIRNRKDLRINLYSLEAMVLSGLVINIFFIILPRLLMHLKNSPNQKWIPCLSAGKSFYTLECFLQSATNGHYGIRTFYMLVAASFIGCMAFFLGRTDRVYWKIFSRVILGLGFFVSSVSLFCKAFNIAHILPDTIMYNSYGPGRMTILFSNPGWVWPYLTPSLILSVWGVLYTRSLSRIIHFVIYSTIMTACVFTLQRGAILVVTVVSLLGIIDLVLRKSRFSRMGIAVSVVLVLSVFMPVITSPDYLNYLILKYTSLNRHIFMTSTERVSLWLAAWNLFKQHPFLGNGYASWFSIITSYTLLHPEVYAVDTAHNLFIQLFVELGIFHSLLIIL
ncbi:MAG: O-antigen ligase family protein, partial [Oligoflexales bacterium]|nr:O-antigen ligase family protein [Oligoflexales bacterium]